MNNLMPTARGFSPGGKKILALSIAVLFLPFFAGAATLNSTLSTGTLFPVAGGTTSVSGSCGTAGANNSVSFTLVQNGVSTAQTASLTTDSNGTFSGNIVFTGSVNPGAATLIANCNRSGDTINSQTMNFAAPVSTAFGLSQTSPTVGGLYNLTGACGASNGTGSVQLSLTGGGNTYPLDTTSLSPSGTFSDNVVIPSNLGIGQGTFKATCSNGSMFSSYVNIGPAAVNMFAFGSNPVLGASTMISGNCTDVNSNANATVSFSAMRSGTIVTLPATNALTNSSGFFNSSVFFPSNMGSDPATLVVTCPNGSTFSNVIMLGMANPVQAAAITPVGGIAAGYGPKDESNYFIGAGILLAVGLLGLFAVSGKNIYGKK